MTTSKLAAIGIGSLTLVLIIVVGAFTLRPTDTLAFGPSASVAPATTASEITLVAAPTQDRAGQQPASQQLVDQINRLLEERKAAYQQQIDELSSRVQNGQAQVKNLETQEQALQQQLTQLQNARTQRQSEYSRQLNSAEADLNQHYAQYNAQFQEIEARLAQANALLGR